MCGLLVAVLFLLLFIGFFVKEKKHHVIPRESILPGWAIIAQLKKEKK